MNAEQTIAWRVRPAGPTARVALADPARLTTDEPSTARRTRHVGLLRKGSWVLPILSFLALWEFVSQTGVVEKSLLTPPTQVAPTVIEVFTDGEAFTDLRTSLGRAALGFGIASTGGIVVGLAIGWISWLRRFVSPIAELFRQLPPLALLPVFVLLFGLGIKSQVAMVAWAVVWPVLLSTVSGAASIDPRLIKAARSLGSSGVNLFTRVAFPGAIPSIMTGLRLGASYALLVLVSAEMIGANSGIGYRIMETSNTFRIPQMYAYIVILAVLGVALNYTLLWLNRRLFPWMSQ